MEHVFESEDGFDLPILFIAITLNVKFVHGVNGTNKVLAVDGTYFDATDQVLGAKLVLYSTE